MLFVRDHIPLEQGLRQAQMNWKLIWMPCQRPYSIRTRIKTWQHGSDDKVYESQRPYSIRTRIKTAEGCLKRLQESQRPYSIRTRIKTWWCFNRSESVFVRDHIPLEQGLRPLIRCGLVILDDRQRPYSIRTRIKTKHSNLSFGFTITVRDHIPLEQGLRLGKICLIRLKRCLSETIFH